MLRSYFFFADKPGDGVEKEGGTKGAPARESRTGTRLVSPTQGCEKKKKDTSETRPQNANLSI